MAERTKPKRLVRGKAVVASVVQTPGRNKKTKAKVSFVLFRWDENVLDWLWESSWPLTSAANKAFKKYAIAGEVWSMVKVELPEIEYQG